MLCGHGSDRTAGTVRNGQKRPEMLMATTTVATNKTPNIAMACSLPFVRRKLSARQRQTMQPPPWRRSERQRKDKLLGHPLQLSKRTRRGLGTKQTDQPCPLHLRVVSLVRHLVQQQWQQQLT